MMAATDGRLTSALLRPSRDADPVAADVDDAIAEAGRRLRAIVDEHGPDAVALYVSGQMSIEAQYLATSSPRASCAPCTWSRIRGCAWPVRALGTSSHWAPTARRALHDFDCADLFFVIGSNMADCHPILFLRMADRLKAGAKLIVVDPRRTATAEKADLFLQIRPGTDLALLNGILHLLVENGAIDERFHRRAHRGLGGDAARSSPTIRRPGSPTSPVCAETDIRTAAAMIADAGDWMSCWTMGLNQSTHGTWNTNAICNLHLATGAICRPGSGPMSLTGQPNAMGGREMGYMGPGSARAACRCSSADGPRLRRKGCGVSTRVRSAAKSGPARSTCSREMSTGEIKACWIICTNPVASVPNRKTVINGLELAELVITQDIYPDTATNSYADIVLPATLWAEADGVMVNSERTLTLAAAVRPARR